MSAQEAAQDEEQLEEVQYHAAARLHPNLRAHLQPDDQFQDRALPYRQAARKPHTEDRPYHRTMRSLQKTGLLHTQEEAAAQAARAEERLTDSRQYQEAHPHRTRPALQVSTATAAVTAEAAQWAEETAEVQAAA